MRKCLLAIVVVLIATSCISNRGDMKDPYERQIERLFNFGKTQQINSKYSCLIEAYADLGAAVLPRPLPVQTGGFGEKIYNINTAKGNIPMYVFGHGNQSFAPGEAFGESLEDSGMLGKLSFSDGSFEGLKEIHMWVFSNQNHISGPEAVELSRKFPVIYSLVNGKTANAGLLNLLHTSINGSTSEEVLQKYGDFVEIQKNHEAEITAGLIERLEQGRVNALTYTGNAICDQYSARVWQEKINYIQTLQKNGEMQIPFQGVFHRFTKPEWKDGEWGLIVLVTVDEFSSIASDPSFIIKGDRVSNYYADESGNIVPNVYNYTRLGGMPLALHEISHGVVGGNELYADMGAEAWLERAFNRFKSGDFRADIVVVDNKGNPVPPQFYP